MNNFKSLANKKQIILPKGFTSGIVKKNHSQEVQESSQIMIKQMSQNK
jgi:hypothetical protein